MYLFLIKTRKALCLYHKASPVKLPFQEREVNMLLTTFWSVVIQPSKLLTQSCIKLPSEITKLVNRFKLQIAAFKDQCVFAFILLTHHFAEQIFSAVAAAGLWSLPAVHVYRRKFVPFFFVKEINLCQAAGRASLNSHFRALSQISVCI